MKLSELREAIVEKPAHTNDELPVGKVDRKKEPNARSIRYYKNKEAKKNKEQ